MKRILVIFLVFFCNNLIAGLEDISPSARSLWYSWKQTHNRTYVDDYEESKRETLFMRRINFVNAHNMLHDEGKVGFRLAVYGYADLSRDEFLELRTGLKIFHGEDFKKKIRRTENPQDFLDETTTEINTESTEMNMESSTYNSTRKGKNSDENSILKDSNSTETTIDCILKGGKTPQESEEETVPIFNDYGDYQQITTVPPRRTRRTRKTTEYKDPTERTTRTRRTRRTTTPSEEDLLDETQKTTRARRTRKTTTETDETKPIRTRRTRATTESYDELAEETDFYDEETVKTTRPKRTRRTTTKSLDELPTRTQRTRRTTTKRERVTRTPRTRPITTTTAAPVNKKNFSWVTQGFVTSVKDQKACGSCWAFAINAAMESQFLMHKNLSIDLSEQQLVDCDVEEWGCDGGDPYAAMNWLKSHPITTESNYPYKARDLVCRKSSSWKSYKVLEQTKNYMLNGNEEALLALVRDHGPVVVGIHASDYFQSYRSGIFVDHICNYEINHAVIVVGYGVEKNQDYWIIKNSWGSQWGEKGYARMARNKNNMCRIASYGSVPKVSSA